MMLRWLAGAAIAMTCALTGCDQELPSPKDAARTPAPVHESAQEPLQEDYHAALAHYRDTGTEWLDGLVDCTSNLLRQRDTFLATPDDTTLKDLRNLTHHCHQRYQATLALTGTGDAREARLASLRHRIDSRPITPGYVDYVQDYPDSGIVNDPTLPLTAQNLIAEQGLTDPADVVLGFEVVLFLLEGEHRYAPALPQRPVSDYVPAREWSSAELAATLPLSEHSTHRRRRYLDLTLDILLDDIKRLRAAWKDWAMPESQDEANALTFSIIRNWHSVASSLPASDVGPVTDTLLTLIDGQDTPGIAQLTRLNELDGWPRQGEPVDPIRLGQAVGNWMNQHYQ